MQRGLSSFDIYVIVSELQELLGSYIDKTYQLTRDELLIKVNNRKIKQKESIYQEFTKHKRLYNSSVKIISVYLSSH